MVFDAQRFYFYSACRRINFGIKKEKTGKMFLVLGVIFYYFFSITPAADLILAPLENQYQTIGENELDKTDTIVLLLGGRESDVLRASEVLRIFKFQFSHFNQFSNSNFHIIISGADPLVIEQEEAKNLKIYLAERGIPSENIIVEDKSRNTKENAENVKKLVGEKPFFLVTSAYHMPRSVKIFKKINANPIAAPADFKTKHTYSILDFFPDAKNLRNSDLAFHEYLGIVFYDLAY